MNCITDHCTRMSDHSGEKFEKRKQYIDNNADS